MGVLVRLRALAFNRSLWMDEALLANNLLARDFTGLLRPLADQQSAPIGFLWAAEAASRAFGSAEWALRLPALVGGVAALAFMVLLARAALDSPAARLTAVAAAAVSASAVYFSAELKPYAWDMAAGAALAWLGLAVMRRPDARSALWLGFGACAALVMSSAAAFAVAGVFAVVGADLARARRWRPLGWLGLAAAAAGGTFAVHYAIVLRHAADEAELFNYWRAAFPPSPWTGDGLRWLASDLPWLAGETLGLARPTPVLLAGLAGAAWLAWRHPWRLALLAAPAALVYVAGVARLYPMYPRLLMVLAPAGFVLVAAAVSLIGEIRFGRPLVARVAAAVVGAALLLDTVFVAGIDLLAPRGREELRDVLAALAASAEPGDRFYVMAEARFAYAYYVATRPRLDLSRIGPTVVGQDQQLAPEQVAAQLADLARGGRAWVVYSHMVYRPGAVEAGVRERMDAAFVPLGAIEAPGASAEGWADAGRSR